MAGFAGWGTFSAALSHRPFVTYASGSFVSLVGNWAQRVAVGWLAWELTGSELWVGLVAFADLIPGVLIAPLAGALADRSQLLRLCITIQLLGLVQAVALLIIFLTGNLEIYLLFLLTFGLGVISALDYPARLSLLPDMLPRSYLSAGVAVNSMLFNLARFIGPLGAGLAISFGRIEAIFVANAASYLVFVVTLVALNIRIASPARTAPTSSFLMDVRSGVAYALTHKDIAGLMLVLAVTAAAVRPLVELLPPFADQLVDAGMAVHGGEALAILTSTMAFGAFAASLTLAMRGNPATLERVVIFFHLVSVASLLLFLFLPYALLRLLMVAICGYALVFTGVGTQTIIQVAVDQQMRGRVLSLFAMTVRGVPALGALTIGWVATRTGLQVPFAIGAAVSIIAIAFTWRHYHRERS